MELIGETYSFFTKILSNYMGSVQSLLLDPEKFCNPNPFGVSVCPDRVLDVSYKPKLQIAQVHLSRRALRILPGR